MFVFFGESKRNKKAKRATGSWARGRRGAPKRSFGPLAERKALRQKT
jgi:hypothetical protein